MHEVPVEIVVASVSATTVRITLAGAMMSWRTPSRPSAMLICDTSSER